MSLPLPPLDLTRLRAAYARGLSPVTLTERLLAVIEARGDDGVWISRVPNRQLLARARELAALPRAERERLHLFGVPFSVKDCIDAAGLPTTSACPAYAYQPERSNLAVERLLRAGALLVGKTNMDQFATGLNGTRTPYGIARNPFDDAYIPGGSSSGAAVSVAAGLVSFALGTDTGGSGRVPAAFNNVVGLKPTRGRLSGIGVVPACRSIETVSVFALTAPDALSVLDIAEEFDLDDPFARLPGRGKPILDQGFRVGVPQDPDFFGDAGARALFLEGVDTLAALGGQVRTVDYAPFADLNELLFNGPWLAERYGALAEFIDSHPGGVLPLTRDILLGGRHFSGAHVFSGLRQLLQQRREIDTLWREIDVLVVPTTPTIYRIEEMLADPLVLNARLGTYTSFINFADLAGVAVPNGFLSNGLPQGVTLLAPAWSEPALTRLADRFHRARGVPLGATGAAHPDIPITEKESA